MVSKRTQELTSFIVMDVLEKAKEMEREGVHVIHLEVGEPDFDAPDVREGGGLPGAGGRATPTTPTAWATSSCGRPSPSITGTPTASAWSRSRSS